MGKFISKWDDHFEKKNSKRFYRWVILILGTADERGICFSEIRIVVVFFVKLKEKWKRGKL